MAMARRDELVDQFVFDFYVNKCFRELKYNNWIITEKVSIMLKALMTMTLGTDYPGNKFKAHLLIIVNSLISLKDMGLEDSFDHIADLDRTDVLQQLDHIQSSIENLWPESASTLKELSRECLFQIYVLFVSIISHGMSDEVTGLEDLKLLERVLKRMKSVTNFQSNSEKNMFSQCERALLQPGLCLDFPQPNKLWSLVRNLVLEASLLIETPSECVCQVEHKLNGEKVLERRCKLLDLQEVVGKTFEVFQDERVLVALREKCDKIKREKQYCSNICQGQLELSTESNPVLKSCSPQKEAIALNQDSITESRFGSENISQLYPKLSSIKPRWSLLNFGNSKKPPSHVKIAGGKWQTDEEETFIVKTVEIGEGKWSEIKNAVRSQRSNVQLKDKWRQIPLSRIRKVARNHGLVYRGSKKN